MKSKVAAEVLRDQLHSSLTVFSKFSSTEEITIEYTLEENENINVTLPAVPGRSQDGTYWEREPERQIKAFGLLLLASQTINGETQLRRLWLRQYPIVGSLNEIRYQAFKELYDIMIGSFIINATRTDNKTLEELSNKKDG